MSDPEQNHKPDADVNEEDQIHLTFTPPLYSQRYAFASEKLRRADPPIVRMADLGCAEGKFIEHLKQLPHLQELIAVDADRTALDECKFSAQPRAWNFIFPRFMHLTIRLMHGSVLVPDPAFRNLDAITCIELIEHLPIDCLSLFSRTLFGYFNPRIIIITTPNCEFNVLFPQLKPGKFRHWDHRFEWTRSEFQDWCKNAASSFSYSVSFSGVGDPPESHAHVGHCSQIAVFERLTTQTIDDSEKTPSDTSQEIMFYEYPAQSGDAVNEKPVEPYDWSFLRLES
jgi:hypothetical protein